VKEHDAALPAPSVKVYVTSVSPEENASPGECVLVPVGSSPESSVAVGGSQETICVESLLGTLYVTDCGQLMTTGSVESTSMESERNNVDSLRINHHYKYLSAPPVVTTV
jgi:hypothetical protein